MRGRRPRRWLLALKAAAVGYVAFAYVLALHSGANMNQSAELHWAWEAVNVVVGGLILALLMSILGIFSGVGLAFLALAWAGAFGLLRLCEGRTTRPGLLIGGGVLLGIVVGGLCGSLLAYPPTAALGGAGVGALAGLILQRGMRAVSLPTGEAA